MNNTRMPVLFVGHGSPMNAIEDNEYSRAWKEIGNDLPRPRAILSISAHWLTRGTSVTAMEKPRTIHDFGGFPQKLFEQQYPAPGSPELSLRIRELITKTELGLDESWGLDHGTWSVLLPMFPAADIPVVQFSIDYHQAPRYHYELGQQLSQLRDEGVLIFGSGNIVHNLRQLRFDGQVYSWATEFDELIAEALRKRNDSVIVDYTLLRGARESVPTPDHYYPLLYVLGAAAADEPVQFFTESLALGATSMRSVKFG